GGHREPCIARWPSVIKPGTSTDQLICLTDLMATCAAIIGTDLPEHTAEDSYNFLPTLTGSDNNTPIRQSVIHHSVFGVFSLRHQEWKLILGTQGSGGWPPPRGNAPDPDSPGQLYHLWDDPAERHNLWDDHPEVVQKLTHLLEKYQAEGRST
ncbi:MAG: arylsulfatase, partial [Candidatus Poribacteria bacterium]